MSIETLRKIVTPPKSPVEAPRATQWTRVEKQLGTKLPTDYKALIASYGTGNFDDFIWLANPFSTLMPWSPWFERTLAALRVVRDGGGKKAASLPVFPDEGGLLPWASSENGNIFAFLTKGKPDAWPVVVFEGRGQRWDALPGTATEALGAVLSKKHVSPMLPDWFPKSAKHRFTVMIDEHKAQVAIALDETRPFEERFELLRKHAGKAKAEPTRTRRGNLSIPGTSIHIEYTDCDIEDHGRLGARLFAVYASSDEAELRRIVRDVVADARWTIEHVIDFKTKQPLWKEGP